MIAKLKLVNGIFECFHTESYQIGSVKDFNPYILSVTLLTDNGVAIKRCSRPFKWWYKHITFKSAKVQDEIKRLESEKIIEAGNDDVTPEVIE